jgi:DNA-binding MurR/RpiR family transcriptional regulator
LEFSYQLSGPTAAPAAAPEPAGVLARLGSLIPSLRESERKIGEYVLANASDVVYLSVTDLADRTATSEASVIRFARQLGYAGYAALKISLALELRAAAVRLPTELTASSDAAGIKRRVLQLSIDSLQDTAQLLDDAALEGAIAALAAARRIEVYGVGGSGVAAQAAGIALMQIGLPAVAYTDPHLQIVAATQLRAGDVALAISKSGSTRDIVEALRAARDGGATCVCITRYARSPVTRVAHLTLLAPARPATVAGLPVSGEVARFAILEMLVAAAAARVESSAATLARGRQAISARRYQPPPRTRPAVPGASRSPPPPSVAAPSTDRGEISSSGHGQQRSTSRRPAPPLRRRRHDQRSRLGHGGRARRPARGRSRRRGRTLPGAPRAGGRAVGPGPDLRRLPDHARAGGPGRRPGLRGQRHQGGDRHRRRPAGGARLSG